MKTKVLVLAAVVVLPVLAGSITMTARFDRSDLLLSSSGGYDVVELAGGAALVLPGMPRVPRVVQAVAIPAGALPTGVTVTAEEWTRVPGKFNLVAAQPDVPLPMPGRTFLPRLFPRDAAVYGSSAPYPSVTAKLLEPGTMNGYRIAHVELHPVRYVPATGELELATRLSYRLDYAAGGGDDVVPTAGQKAEYGALVRGLVANPGDVAGFAPRVARSAAFTLPAGTYEYVIITESPLDTVFKRLGDWKKLKGITDTVVKVSWITSNYSGYDTPEKIRNFIIDAHSTWGANYVLLGGSADFRTSGQNIVPGRRCYYITTGEGGYTDEDTIPCDLYYAGLNGTWDANGNHVYGQLADNADMYADVHVGRASVYTVAQAQNFVSKVFTYEQNPPTGYIKKMLLSAGILWSSYDERPMQDSIARMTPSGWLDAKLYERNGLLSESRMIDSMNSGYGLGHWVGHGNEYGIYYNGGSYAYLTSSDADGLSNGNKEGVHISISCFGGAWDETPGGDCFAEHLMNRVGGGAAAMIMNSRYGFGAYTTQYVPGPSERLDTTFMSAVLSRNNYHAGPALSYAKSSWASYADSGGRYDMTRWCIYELNLFGDPEMPVWTDEPGTLTASHSGQVPVGSNIPYPVTISSAGTPVDSVLVVLWKGTEVYTKGYTDASGSVTLTVSPQSAGIMLLTATARNYYPLRDTVDVIADQHDVGCTRILAPAGTIDSTASVAPACSTYNYGNQTESYRVRMKVGGFYNDTARVTSQAPGARACVTFPSRSAWPRGTWAVTCSTELAGDYVPSNDKDSGTVSVRVLDAGTDTITTPVNNRVYSPGTALTPAATVHNYGNVNETIPATFTVSGGYSNTQTASGVGSGATRSLSFSQTTPAPGYHTMACATGLSGDMRPANDQRSGAFLVMGLANLTYPVSVLINNRTPLFQWDDLAGATSYVIQVDDDSDFSSPEYSATPTLSEATPSTPLADGRYYWRVRGVNVLSGNWSAVAGFDLDATPPAAPALLAPANGTVGAPAQPTFVWGHVTMAGAPGKPVRGTDDPGTNYRIQVANNPGFLPTVLDQPTPDTVLTCPVTLAAGVQYWWRVDGTDDAGNTGNWGGPSTFTVVLHDAGATEILAPADHAVLSPATPLAPRARVHNFGNVSENVPVRFSFTGYGNSQTVAALAPGGDFDQPFASSTPAPGYYVTSCATSLAGDADPANDSAAPTDFLVMGLANLTYPVSVLINDPTPTFQWDDLAGAASYVIEVDDDSDFSSPEYSGTAALSQATPTTPLADGHYYWRVRGVNVLSGNWSAVAGFDLDATAPNPPLLLAPANGDSNVAVSPTFVWGTVVAVLGAGGIDNPGTSYHLQLGGDSTFALPPAWETTLTDTTAVCGVVLNGASRYFWRVSGEDDAHNVGAWGGPSEFTTVAVGTLDAGVAAINVPTGILDTSAAVSPAAVVGNYGTLPATFNVTFTIDSAGTIVYLDTRPVTLGAGSSAPVTFAVWTKPHAPGSYATRCSTDLADDVNPANNVLAGSFRIAALPPAAPGWSERRAVPGTPSPKGVYYGSFLVGTGDAVYGAKGGKTGDFYRYDPVTDNWAPVSPWPAGTENKGPARGAAACYDGSRYIYATKGNNTDAFWRYDVVKDSWREMAKGVPLGPSNRKVREGTGMAYVSPGSGQYVYLLKGYKNEFWAYDVVHDAWVAKPDAPSATNPRWKNGSFVAYDGSQYLYAAKAGYHEFWRYDVTRDAWDKQLAQYPFIYTINNPGFRSKKLKGGGCGTYLDGAVYSLKGGNTLQFFRYDVARDSWASEESMPARASYSSSRSKVRDGAAMAAWGASAYAYKGGRTYESWRYTPGSAAVAERPGRDGVSAATQPAAGMRLSVAPNPLRADIATVRCQLPPGSHGRLSVCDALGRRVFRSTFVATAAPVTVDLNSLAAGVYVVELESGGLATSQKLVVQR